MCRGINLGERRLFSDIDLISFEFWPISVSKHRNAMNHSLLKKKIRDIISPEKAKRKLTTQKDL